MHVIHPATYQPRPKKRRRWPWLAALLLLAIVLGTANYLRPLAAPTAAIQLPAMPQPSQPNIAWPSYGQAAIGAPGYGVLASNGAQTPLATASIAKIITALCVLQKAPLQPGQTGPTYTITTTDVGIYDTYVAEDGSTLRVVNGEQLTEYQALEALLLPSANNIADSLANWVFGDHASYVTYATQFLAQHNLTHTTVGSDASGFDPSTTSTASDLTQLGLLALQNPVLMAIAGQSEAQLPVVGTVYNYDTVLGTNGINGLKTGNNNTDQGAFLFTAAVPVGDKTIPVAGAVMSAPDLDTALHSATQLAASLASGFHVTTLIKARQQLGTMQTNWGSSAPIFATQPLTITYWQAEQLQLSHHVHSGSQQGTVGDITMSSGTAEAVTNLQLKHSLAAPSFWWRLTRH